MNIPPFGWRARAGYEPPNNWRPWADPYTHCFPAQRSHSNRYHFDHGAGLSLPLAAPVSHYDIDDVYYAARHRRTTHHRRRRARFWADDDEYGVGYVPPPASPPPVDDEAELSSTSCNEDGKETEQEPEKPQFKPQSSKPAKSTKSTKSARSTITRTTISIRSKSRSKKGKEKDAAPKAPSRKEKKKPEAEPEPEPEPEPKEASAAEEDGGDADSDADPQQEGQADDMSATSADSDSDSVTASNATPGRKMPGGHRAGTHVLHGQAHTKLHVFTKPGLKPWEPRKGSKSKCAGVPKGSDGNFSIVGADVEWTVEKLMKALGRGSDRWAITEVVEMGGNRWQKGTSVVFGSEMAKRSLAEMGWSEHRGDGVAPPVWIVQHRA